MTQRVTIERRGAVADVQLSRPEKLNALDAEMFSGIIEAGEQLAKDPSVRAVVLSGQGRGFCAGLDFASFMAMGHEGAGTLLGRPEGSPATRAQLAGWVWRQLAVPVIAALHGVAFGGGLQIALACDIRFATRDARLSVREIEWGLVPDMSGTQTLRDLVRLDVAKELTYTGRIVSGEEAAQLGLVTRLSASPRDSALELAAQIAAKSPHAIRSGKRLLEASRQLPTDEALRLEAQLQRELIGTPNQLEAVRANLEKRAPSFEDPK